MSLNLNDVVSVVEVIILQMLQDFEFNTCLVLKLLFVSDNFDGYNFSCLMIVAFKSLTKTTFS
jgi:hypothetical protein